MFFKHIFLSALLINHALSVDNNITNPLTNTTVEYNLPASSEDDNKSKWNINNWGDKLNKENGEVGNTMLFMNKSPFLKKSASTTDTSELTVEAFNNSEELKDTKAATGYNENFRSQFVSKAQANTSYKANNNTYENTLDCFIARDLPFRYKCEETGQVFGGDTLAQNVGGSIANMDGMSGKEALNLCKENCKQQFECIEVNTGQADLQSIASEQFEFTQDYIKTISTTSQVKKIKDIKFDINATSLIIEEKNQQNIFLDIYYIDKNNKTQQLVKKLHTKSLNSQQILSINNYAKSIKIKFYSDNKTAISKISITSILINYDDSSKYICPFTQDISSLSSESFGYKCPSGQINTFGEYKICSSGTNVGDNLDGTFSNQKSCKSSCNRTKKCVVETGNFNANIFEMVREGRLGRIAADGDFTSAQSNLIKSDTDCAIARKNGSKIINEVIIDAKNNPVQTVLNGVLIPNIHRPRILNDAGVDHQANNKEEWKDKAYDNMLSLGTYSESNSGIGEDTNSSFSYYVNLRAGADYGNVEQTSMRELFWRLKPAALLYNNDTNYRLYTVVKVDVEKYEDAVSGQEVIRDQIWYIKTSLADTFVPFVRAENYGSARAVNISTGDIVPAITLNSTSQFAFQTFSGGNWVGVSSSTLAPSFHNLKFIPNDFWYEFKIVGSLGSFDYNLPGLIKSSTKSNVGISSNIYTGKFDGTGNGIVGFEVYTFFSSDPLTYSQLKERVASIDALPLSAKYQLDNYSAKIYKTTAERMFNKFIKPDNIDTSSNVDIFQYGAASKNSLKVRIKPRRDDIGKNGFIYIFVY